MASLVPRISEGGLDLVPGLVLGDSLPDPQSLISHKMHSEIDQKHATPRTPSGK